jgi:REP element-mobilizing transposase RayT
MISPSFEKQLWAYMTGVSKEINVDPIIINGMEDHVHFLASLPATITLADVIKKVKAVSSLWVSRTFEDMTDFEWQVGYGAFSISHYDLQKTIQYIKHQKEHHNSYSFEQEYISLLDENKVKYDKKYLLG